MIAGASEWTHGVPFGLASSAAFGLMGFLVHQASLAAPTQEIAFFRCAASVVALAPLIVKLLSKLWGKDAFIVWLRALAGAMSVLCYFTNLGNISVPNAAALANTAPFFVVLFSRVFLRESLSRQTQLGLLVVFAGAFLLQSPAGSAIPLHSLAVGIGGAVSASVAYLALKQAAQRFPQSLIVWAFSVVTAAVVISSPSGARAITGLSLQLSFLAIGLLGLFAHLWITRSYFLLPSSVASTLGLTAILWGGLREAVAFAKIPSVVSMAGHGAILVRVYLLRGKVHEKIPGRQD